MSQSDRSQELPMGCFKLVGDNHSLHTHHQMAANRQYIDKLPLEFLNRPLGTTDIRVRRPTLSVIMCASPSLGMMPAVTVNICKC
jgi:hypothetical protein